MSGSLLDPGGGGAASAVAEAAIGSIAQTLETYGAWGIVALQFVAIGILWRAYVHARDKNDANLKASVDLVEANTRVATESKGAMLGVSEALRALERRLEAVERRHDVVPEEDDDV